MMRKFGKDNPAFRHGHGSSKDRTYHTWKSMKDRCFFKANPSYKHYGGRGIKVCKKWMDFVGFFEDMGIKPKGLTLERINSNGNYEPSNCKWATIEEQNRNRRNVKFYKHNGSLMTIPMISKKIGIKATTLRWRLENNWNINKVFEVIDGRSVKNENY